MTKLSYQLSIKSYEGGGVVMALPVKIYGAKCNYLHTTREMQYRRETHEYCKFGERHQIFCSE